MRAKVTAGDTAERIFAAADDLFAESGYDGVSARDIARAAGVNKALVFYHFGNKEALFEKVLERYYQAHKRALEGAFQSQGSIEQRLHTLVDAYLDFMADNSSYARMVQREITGRGKHIRPITRSLAPLFTFIEAALSDLAPCDGPLAARHFFVTFSGAVTNYFTFAPVLEPIWPQPPESPEALAERRAHLHWLVDTLVGGLRRALLQDAAKG